MFSMCDAPKGGNLQVVVLEWLVTQKGEVLTGARELWEGLLLDQTCFPGAGDGLRAAVDLQLAVNVLDVGFDCVR